MLTRFGGVLTVSTLGTGERTVRGRRAMRCPVLEQGNHLTGVLLVVDQDQHLVDGREDGPVPYPWAKTARHVLPLLAGRRRL